MITCVCMNPALDKTIELDGFTYGGLNRVKKSMTDASGKAVNVAIVLTRLKDETQLIGINYRDGGEKVGARLTAEGVKSDFVWIDGALRVNIKALDTCTGKITEINESGTFIPADVLRTMEEKIVAAAADSDYIVMTGSLPKGADKSFYRRAIERTNGARCVLDCDGERLSEGIKAKPFLIKPNQYELGLLCGRELNGRKDILNCAREIVRAGVTWVAVSMGGDGAMLVGESEAWFAPALDVPVRSTVGAGDSMVAGLVHGFALGEGASSTLKWGAACGNASVMTEGTRLIDIDAMPDLLKNIECTSL